MAASQAPAAPHTQVVEEVAAWGADPSVKSHTGPVTVPDAEVNVVLSSRHWLSGA